MSIRPAYMQLSVVLPPSMMGLLVDNYKAVKGKTPPASAIILYALDELYHDLRNAEELKAAGISIPDFDPTRTAEIPKSERRAENGFYSMRVPEHFREKWWTLLEQHENNGPALVYRAVLSLYRSVWAWYDENDPTSSVYLKYPAR